MAATGAVAASTAPPLDLGVRLKLSVLMFLEFAIWGSWFVIFYPYLKGRGFTDAQAGALIGNVALGAVFSTVFAGYVADRFFASEKMMAVLHLVGAALLYWMAQIQSPSQFWLLFAVSLAYSLLYNPTLALANSIAFTHIPDATRDFPSIRVLGTLGWIAVGFLIDFLFVHTQALPDGTVQVLPASATNGPLLLAAGLSLVLAVYSLFLPHTPPPADKEGDVVPFVKALGLFGNFSFAVFFVVSFIITIVLAFYYTAASNFLENAAGVKFTGSTMLIGQIAELVLLPLLPIFLWRLGMKWVLALGMLCWGIRYALFAYGGPAGLPFALVILGVALHGFCFDFFFAAGFIHVDNEAPRDIRASGQALFSFLTYGLGMWIGSLFAGELLGRFTNTAGGPANAITQSFSAQGMTPAGTPLGSIAQIVVALKIAGSQAFAVVDWHDFWLVPSVGVLISLVIFVLFFRMR
ncbi:MAG TPA: MFS transporter, partial [Gemmataceae bacterium]|nr:MFS transporter [Gemmataceae bacterium]